MKGIIFRAFETIVAQRFGEHVAANAMELPSLSSGGAYTSVGTYPDSDILALIGSVVEQTGIPTKTLVTEFGEALFEQLIQVNVDIIATYDSAIDLLSAIEDVIHRDVRKLYTDTDLPQLRILDRDGNSYIHMDYQSKRPFADLAEGLIYGCLAHYGVKDIAQVSRQDVATDGTHSRFKVSIRLDD